MIPTMICPIINRPELLDRLLSSVDHPVERVVVIDNGGVVDPFIGGRHLMPYHVQVIQPGTNLGVAASWNLGIKASPLSAWWLIVNSDLEFGVGDLERLEQYVDSRSASLYKVNGFAAFAVTPPLIHEVGWFDEGFVLGYNDDLDFDRRVELAGLPRIEVGFTGQHVGSASIQADASLMMANAKSHPANDRYYAEKWGGPKQGGEKFSTPWDRGDLRDTALDINRLREQIWPRR